MVKNPGVHVDICQERSSAEGVEKNIHEKMKAKGYIFIGRLRPFRGCKFAFVHPKNVNGVLLELFDYPWNEFKKK
jgi:hypothetical protein